MSERASRGRLGLALIPVLAASLAACAGGGPGPTPTTETTPPRTTTGGPSATGRVLDRPKPHVGPSAIASIEDDRLSFFPDVDVTGRMAEIAALGADEVRVQLPWWLVATRQPAKPTDPADPAYDWRRMDAIVDAANANGLGVLFAVFGTPAWAATPGVAPFDGNPAAAFSIRPRDAKEFGAFAVAAARRYAPKGVLRWEGWNEPNLPLYLTPQNEQRDGTWVNVSARTYSDLQKAFYAGIKSVAPNAEVGGLVTAPSGTLDVASAKDPTQAKTEPRAFLRLLDDPGLRPPMDVVSHHPYPQNRTPSEKTFAGAAYVDLYNLGWLEEAIDASYLRGKPLWLTEFGFPTEVTTNLRFKVTPERQARYLSDAYARTRKDPRVRLFSWYFLQDNDDWKSGLKASDGSPKPAYRAFEFPVAPDTARPVARGAPVRVYGQVRGVSAPTTVRIERRRGGDWEPLGAELPTKADGSFAFVIRPRATADYRARSGEDRESLPFTIETSGR